MVEHRYIIIEKKDEVYLTIDAESDIRRELSEFFTFEVLVISLCHNIEIDIGTAK